MNIKDFILDPFDPNYVLTPHQVAEILEELVDKEDMGFSNCYELLYEPEILDKLIELYPDNQRLKDFKEIYNSAESYSNEKWDEIFEEYQNDFFLGSFEEVEQHGGENMGSEYWVVFYNKKHDAYIRLDGWYQSYDGVSWDSAEFIPVHQVEVKVKEWRELPK